jgi:ATP-dependent DNA ligase
MTDDEALTPRLTVSKVARPPSGPLWVHEIKHDGYRLMVRRDRDGSPAGQQRGSADRSD